MEFQPVWVKKLRHAFNGSATTYCLYRTTRLVPTGPDAMRTPNPTRFSFVPAQATPTAPTSFSPVGIGIVAGVAIVALIVAGVCLRMRHQAKQNSNDKDDKDVAAITAEQGGAAATNYAVTSACDPCASSGTRDVVQAVLEAANDLALNSQFPGVSEAATLVSTLVNLISNDRGRLAESDARLKRCRLLVTMLQQAATVLGKVRVSACRQQCFCPSGQCAFAVLTSLTV